MFKCNQPMVDKTEDIEILPLYSGFKTEDSMY